MLDNPFLESLAEGGFQVGELAKVYFPEGIEIETLDHQEAIERTEELLKRDSVVLFEPAIRFENLFIRVDILIKEGTSLEFLEVKAKSFSPSNDSFVSTKGGILKKWKPYLYDVAFQKYVIQRAFPDYHVTSSLYLVNKESICTTDGLNQKFRVRTDENGRKTVVVSEPLSQEEMANKLLVKVNTDDVAEYIYEHELTDGSVYPGNTFTQNIHLLSDIYLND